MNAKETTREDLAVDELSSRLASPTYRERVACRFGVDWADDHPKSPWHDLNEDLPPVGKTVLIAYLTHIRTSAGKTFELRLGKYLKKCWIDNEGGVLNKDMVLAWTPIPQFVMKGGEE